MDGWSVMKTDEQMGAGWVARKENNNKGELN